jgi:hypothetical protein
MKDDIRAPKIVRSQGGKPHVPVPHDADYSAPVSDEAFEMIKKVADQDVLSSGKTLQRFEW